MLASRLRRWEQPPSWLRWRWVRWLRNPYVQMRLGLRMMAVTSALWIWSQATNHSEPPQILALSWLAVWVTGLTLVLLTDVGETTKDDD